MADTEIDAGSDGLAPLVHVKLESTPETLTLVRGVLGALSETLSLDPELLDDLKTAISEACNNVVLHAYGGEPGPLEVSLHITNNAILAVIADEGAGIPEQAHPEDGVHGVGIPLMRALSDRLEFRGRPGGGAEVRLEFAGRRGGSDLFTAPGEIAGDDGWAERLNGDAVVSISPLTFVGPVLGRLARALAARARFSLDRFSDVYLVTDAIAAHVARTSASGRVGFAITTDVRRLEMVIGPLQSGSGAGLEATGPSREPGLALTALSDDVQSRPTQGGELLAVVMTDAAGAASAARA
jgi:anti-sigma regulatory factor (Ser/Thr protein kinase)